MVLDVDELIARVDLEERVYRHRCVERWAMTVPWIGFPVRKLVEIAKPLGSAKYLRMETFGDPAMASGIREQSWYPWPYTEGITINEAMNDLPLLVVGAYGKLVSSSMGAPIRLHLPWKYGFKSVKSIVRFTFTEERPVSFLGRDQRQRVRLLGQCEPGGAASALEPGLRAAFGHRRSAADPRSITAMATPWLIFIPILSG